MKIGDTKPDEDNYVRIDEARGICAGLVTEDFDRGVIRLIHYTTSEYFKLAGASWIAKSSECIASTCLTYLTFQNFTTGPCKNAADLTARMAHYPLSSYAADNWERHTYDSQEQVRELAVRFLQDVNLVLAACQMYDCATYQIQYRDRINLATLGVHQAAKLGLHNVCLDLIANGFPVNPPDGYGQSPLSLAAQYGHFETVKALLARDDIAADSADHQGLTALSWAAQNGYEEVVKLLLSRGDVNADSADCKGSTPLSRAAARGQKEVVKLLLSREDVAADSVDLYDLTPLSKAAENGDKEVVELLLGREDVVADSAARNGMTPLSWAAESGKTEVVKLLLSRGDVDANSIDDIGSTPLFHAAAN